MRIIQWLGVVGFGLLASVTTPLQAEVVVQWNFNTITPGNISTATPSTGFGTLSLLGGVTTPTSGSNGAGSSDTATPNLAFQTTTYAAQGAGDRTRGVQFLASTVGFEQIQVSWDQRHSNTSSRYWALQYTVDGSNWIEYTATGTGTLSGLYVGDAGDTWFNQRSADLSGVAGVANNANFGIRLLAAFDPNTGTGYAASNSASSYAGSGTARFDMFTVSGITAIPEPSSMVGLGILGGAGLLRVRLRKKKIAAT